MLSMSNSWLPGALVTLLGFGITIYTIMLSLEGTGRIAILKQHAKEAWRHAYTLVFSYTTLLAINMLTYMAYIVALQNVEPRRPYTLMHDLATDLGLFILLSTAIGTHKVIYILRNFTQLAFAERRDEKEDEKA